jgi:hypothetical protein
MRRRANYIEQRGRNLSTLIPLRMEHFSLFLVAEHCLYFVLHGLRDHHLALITVRLTMEINASVK